MPDDPRTLERIAFDLDSRMPERPRVLLTLGSGLSGVADAIERSTDIPVAAVPGLAAATVAGHAGVLRAGRLAGVPVLAQLGRVHLYEGHEPSEVTRTVAAAAVLGCDTYIVTNASGGLQPTFHPGELLVIADQINLTGVSPLTGVLRDGQPVFTDMSAVYDPDLLNAAVTVAERQGMKVHTGVYVGLRGPEYETPAEVQMLRTLGADVVGMSTVLEAIVARSRGMRVLGLSAITNVHGGGASVSHEEVLRVGRTAGEQLGKLVIGVVERLAD